MELLHIFAFFCVVLNGIHSIKIIPHTPEWEAKIYEFIQASDTEADDVPPVRKDQVGFFLFKNENRDQAIALTEENLDELSENTEKLFVIIHGWLENKDQPWIQNLKNALLDRYPKSNVIEVDYSDPAFDIYGRSIVSAKYVGQIVGDLLISINNKRNISTKNMILLPHSLGSHVSGFAGKTVAKVLPKISRIIAMDPAGPIFVDKPCEGRLCKTDADAVVALHTDAGNAGFPTPLGTIDFYANGGYKQKGCMEFNEADPLGSACNHCRSYEYMTEAIKFPQHFKSKKCADWRTFDEDQEKCDKTMITLGDFDTKEEGVYYFSTHEKAPFAMEEDDGKSSAVMVSSLLPEGAMGLVSLLLIMLTSSLV